MAKPQSIQQVLREHLVGADSIGRNRKGNIVVRNAYFYGIMADGSEWGDKVINTLREQGREVELVACGNHYAAFKGGASVAKGSHYWAEIKENM